MKLGSDFRGVGQYMALGIQMVVVTIVGAGIGYWLDERTGREPLFLILFFFLGRSRRVDAGVARAPERRAPAGEVTWMEQLGWD